MAKVFDGDDRPTRAPSLRGAVMVDTYRGVTRVRRWPRGRGKPKTLTHKQQVEWFTKVRKANKYTAGRQQDAARKLVTGTPLYYGDLLMSGAAGRLWGINIEGGLSVVPYRMMSEVSEALDSITQTPGQILRRGDQLWEGADPSGGGGSALWIAPNILGPSSADFSTDGWIGMPAVAIEIQRIVGMYNFAGNDVTLSIATAQGFAVDTILFQSDPIARDGSSPQTLDVTLPTPVQIPAGQRIIVAASSPPGSFPSGPITNKSDPTPQGIPWLEAPQGWQTNKGTLSPADGPAGGPGPPYSIGLQISA